MTTFIFFLIFQVFSITPVLKSDPITMPISHCAFLKQFNTLYKPVEVTKSRVTKESG